MYWELFRNIITFDHKKADSTSLYMPLYIHRFFKSDRLKPPIDNIKLYEPKTPPIRKCIYKIYELNVRVNDEGEIDLTSDKIVKLPIDSEKFKTYILDVTLLTDEEIEKYGVIAVSKRRL